jgi:hypothetical protein
MIRVRFVAPGSVLLTVLGLWQACNFDSDFERYCANNPRCGADAAPQPETGPDIGADAPADVGPKPELGGDARPDGQVSMYPTRSCLSSSDCWVNEMCSPVGQVCMTLCRTASDCLQPGLDTCDVLQPRWHAHSKSLPMLCLGGLQQFREQLLLRFSRRALRALLQGRSGLCILSSFAPM